MTGLPPSWVETKLGDAIAYGKTVKAEPTEIPDDAWLLELEDIEKDTSKLLARVVFADRKSKSTKNRFSAGDVLYGKLRPYLNKVLLADRDGFCTTEIVPLKANSVVDGGYLFHWLRHPRFLDYVTGISHGLNMPRLGTDAGRQAPFVLAPIGEQRRVARKLDAVITKLSTCRDRLDRVPQILKKFREAVLEAAYTGKLTAEFRRQMKLTDVASALASVDRPPRPNRFNSMTTKVVLGDYAVAVGNPKTTLPQGWRWTHLLDVARMESGHTPSRGHPEYWGGPVPWVGIADAKDWHGKTIPETKQHTNSLGLANSAARLLPTGTVCLSRTASVGYVVRMGKPMSTSQDFANWICTPVVDPDWLKYLFVAENQAIWRFGEGTTHTTVYFPELLAFHVALPPIEEQRELVRRIDYLFAYADSLQRRISAAALAIDGLAPCILAKAFRGQLVPQDPNDEPAVKLMQRVRSAVDSAAPAAGRAQRESK